MEVRHEGIDREPRVRPAANPPGGLGGIGRTVTGAIECSRHRPLHRTVTSVEQLGEPWHCDFAGRPSSGRFG